MSFYKEDKTDFFTSNRIPKDSVVFAKEEYELSDFADIVAQVTHEENIRLELENNETIEQLKAEIVEMLKREEAWEEEKKKVLREVEKQKAEIIAEKNNLEREKKLTVAKNEQIIKKENEIEKNAKNLEIEKMKFFLENKNMALKIGIDVAEEIIAQKVSLKDIDVEWMIMSLLKKMPSEFSNLNITVSPETYDNLKDNQEMNWLFSGAEWSFDFRLKYGEFILKQEDEYKVFIYDEAFSMIREQIEDLEE